jgi:HTH-type transcriptional regulator, sugar sensing transcriptional regulator
MKELEKVGLTEGEAKVYSALLELKSSTVGPIVKRSKVAYSNIYDILNRLIDKGIVSYILKKKTKYFQALKPSHLIDYLDNKEKEVIKQKQELKEISKKLEELQTFESEQQAEIFLGEKGLKSAYGKFVTEETKEILYLYSHEKRYAQKSDLFYSGVTDIWKNTKMKGISNEDYKKSSYYKKNKKMLNIKFVDFPIPGNIDIGKDKILIVSWEKQIVAILIHSKSIAESFRNYFEELWGKAKK